MTRRSSVAWIVGLSLQSAAQVAVVPTTPRAQDTVLVHMDSSAMGGEWVRPDVSMSANKIMVTVHEPDITFNEVMVADLNWALGQFPAGTYQLEVLRQSASGGVSSLGQTSFVVSPRGNGNVPATNYSDMWWSPMESGWGLSIHQHPSNILFVVWFVYGSDGNATWYVMPTGQWQSAFTYSGPIYRTKGPYFVGAFDPLGVSVSQVGSGTFQFGSYQSGAYVGAYETAMFSWTIDGVSGQKSIVRQSF